MKKERKQGSSLSADRQERGHTVESPTLLTLTGHSVLSVSERNGRHPSNKKRINEQGEDQEAAVQMSSTVIPPCQAVEVEIPLVPCT